MLTRKRKCPQDEYVESISISIEKKHKAEQFYENLRIFYRRKWGFSLKLPSVNGRNFDLSELYEAVTSLGGWQKVTAFDRWNEVLQRISVDDTIQLAEHAIRFLYMQYLSKYEQNEIGGDIVDEHENELLGGRATNRSKGISAFSFYYEPPFSIPKTTVNNAAATPNFHKVIYSLLSGLPNEIAFGLNVLTVISHPGPFILNFTHCPQLINILVALLGIIIDTEEPESLSNLHNWWRESSGYDFMEFWLNAGIKEKELLPLISNPNNLERKCPATNIFDQVDDFDLNKPINWRVFNVLGILNNLSFEEVNQQPMGENKALLRLLLLCSHCRWTILQRNALEALSNISKNTNLLLMEESMPSGAMLSSIQSGLHSNDKFRVLRSMEIIAGLCKVIENESAICDFLDCNQVLSRVLTLLSLKDILISVVALETLLQLSELGKTTCELIGSFGSSIDILIEMLTTDANSFGQTGLYGIQVVEVRGHHTQPYTKPIKKPSQTESPAANYQYHQMPMMTALPTTQIQHPQNVSTPENLMEVRQYASSKHTQSNVQAANFASEYMCEWMMLVLDGGEEKEPCSRSFPSANQLLFHIYHDHLKTLVQSHSSTNNSDEVCLLRCRWPMCDNTPRTLWSMTTHLQDVHCTEYSLGISLRKKYEMGLDEYINQIRRQFDKNREPVQQPGYSSFAAYEAIRRHAFVNLRKELTDEIEGPVTRDLRLTAALILRNICKHSVIGRRKLRKYERFMSWLSLSKLESSRTLAQCLAEMVKHSSLETG